MAVEHQKYTEEYRKETADYALASEKSVPQIACDLGINYKTLSRWVVKRKNELSDKMSTSGQSQSPEVQQLKKQIRELEMENEFLKKASAFFAKNL